MITFESVGKTFKDGTAAVVDLDLVVPSDQITVIVGPSGCGKTTTLRMVNRMIEPTKGRIVWDGSPIKARRKTTLRRQMGYVIQSGGLFPHRTVIDNIGTVPGLLGWDRSKTRTRSMELLRSVGLDTKLAERYPGQLSGGQQQRVGVARALAADPLVLLMDEPFSAVDPVVRSELHEFFLGLQRELSKTIILITHDIDEAIKLGDQVAILRVGGRLAQAGTPQQVLDEPADAFVEGFVGRDRGYRSLSFLPADGLSLDSVAVVRDASAAETSPTLVVDGEAKPIGWSDPERPGSTLGLGSTFDPESDTLRVALDAALTSPVGYAVAVNGTTGRYAGVVDADAILSQVARTRADQAPAGRESIALDSARHGSGSGDAHDASVYDEADPGDPNADDPGADDHGADDDEVEADPEGGDRGDVGEGDHVGESDHAGESDNVGQSDHVGESDHAGDGGSDLAGDDEVGPTEDDRAVRADLDALDHQARVDEGEVTPHGETTTQGEGTPQGGPAYEGDAFAPAQGQAEERLAEQDAGERDRSGPAADPPEGGRP